ncbi:tetratricopeptide repeat protein [Microcoleus sp.]|uniref:tetratricopeptide repeat protein n=1 Tax=Microcoleus sp. TaxID=44472 RepID=UPI00403EC8D9
MTRSSYVRGLTRFDKGDLSGAVADFNQAIQTQSDYAEAYFYRGLAYSDLRQMPTSKLLRHLNCMLKNNQTLVRCPARHL